ncbi:MAG: ImmA/IrrE family metallo-endopeptidase [Thermodesulfobacteriota bacterium]
MFVRHRCLTRLVEESTGEYKTSVPIPLMPLASWFVENIKAIAFEENHPLFPSDVFLHKSLARWNEAEPSAGWTTETWEDMRYEWYRRHFWMSGAGGSLIPDLAFVRADERLWISWSKPRFSGPRQFEFIEPADVESVYWEGAWHALSEFVAYVAGEARSRRLSHLAWAKEDNPLLKAIHCTAADFISFVAPQESDLLSRLEIDPARDPECSVAMQALRDLEITSETVNEATKMLSQLEKATLGLAATIKQLDVFRQLLMETNTGRPETDGYEAARRLRQELRLDGEPLETALLEQELQGLAKVIEENAESPRNHSAIGVRRDGNACVILLRHARTRHPWARRMELARALGHLLLDPWTKGNVLGAGSSQTNQGPRKRRSGAFAAELLLPKQGIHSFLKGRDPVEGSIFEDMMQHFGVGAKTAAYHLWNQEFLASEDDRDGLIEEYGARRLDG